MVTLTVIVIVVILIWVYKAQVAAEKKVDEVDADERADAIRHLRQVKYNFRDKSKFEKVIRVLNTFDNNPLSIFSYSDQYLFVKYKDGQNFTAHLDQMEVLFRFEPASNSRSAVVTLGGNQFTILEDRDESMTEKEWDTIFDILQCAKITHQRELLTKESRDKAIQQYRTAQMMRRTQRNIARMQRF